MAKFRTKARAVELLGKGQIADLPTAITELWKNGYDAYANNLTAEIYLKEYELLDKPLFIMSDDGKGMSEQDIFDKWLVLGTDSKSRVKVKEKEGEETLWKKPRIKTGEKGIGRLSVSFLGSPMLMITKKMGYSPQALFFDWRLLENYNLFLDDIIIPVKSLSIDDDSTKLLSILRNEFKKNFNTEIDEDGNLIWEESQIQLKERICHSINEIQPSFIVDKIISDFLNKNDSHGTKFIIFEPIDQIISMTTDISDEDQQSDKKFIISSLSGFTNEFQKYKQKITTKFLIYKENGINYDFLESEGKFFTSNDYELADIIIDGEFNGEGTFNGELIIYDEVIKYSYTNPRKKDQRSKYGNFLIKLGYSQGLEKVSKLGDLAFKKMNSKLKKYGGLYIYRDNFRVLPYGRQDFDFLKFEERRSYHAGESYFSHRRMFGYINLTRQNNPKLKDKSSREGLINNAAYRAFRSDLIAFFKELAREYFATKPRKQIFHNQKEILKQESEAITKDKKRERQEKKDFSKALMEYPKKLENYQFEYEKLIIILDIKTKEANVLYSDIEEILDQIHTLDIEYKNMLPKKPKRYKPTETQLDRLDKYQDKLRVFNKTIKSKSIDIMERVKEKLEIKALKNELIKAYNKYNATLDKKMSCNKQILNSHFDTLNKEFSIRAKRILNELNFQKEDNISSIKTKKDVYQETEKISIKFERLRDEVEKDLFPLVDHVKKLSFDIDEELVQGVYKAEYEKIKINWEQTRETAQLGIAVEIIDHEFNHLYATISHSLEKLLSDSYISDSSEFKFLKKNIKQLEEKYDLLSPLYRISGVLSKEISCEKIYYYLKTFFSKKLKRQQVNLKATRSFLSHIIYIKEPIIYTVFINIVNNALYWIRNSTNKIIQLDYQEDTNEILILNSGEKIKEHRLDRIFELFYSNRPNGRGIGLYLSKESLNENYFNIKATNEKIYNKFNGACFIIKSNR